MIVIVVSKDFFVDCLMKMGWFFALAPESQPFESFAFKVGAIVLLSEHRRDLELEIDS